LIRRQSRGPAEGGRRLLQPFQGQQVKAQIEMGVVMVGIDADGLAVVRQGFLGMAQLGQIRPQVCMGLGVVGFEG
jgi:hypothetical protein